MNEVSNMAKVSSGQAMDKQSLTRPLAQYLSERVIRKQLLSDVLQDKRSLLPITLSLSALIYMLLYAPVLGGFVISLGVFLITAFTALSVFFWRYVICFQKNYARKSQELFAFYEAQNLYLEEQRMAETHIILERGFTKINAKDGLKTLLNLDHEYKSLGPVLSSGKETDLLSISNLEAMVKETYYRGLSVLEDVFELERAIHSTDHAQLQAEISELQRKVAIAQADPSQQDRVVQITERIASDQERLYMVSKLKQRAEELLYQAKRCEASLGKTRIELATLKAEASEIEVSAVIETLRNTIDRAREVQEELKQLGY
jgi:hypothetical protein